MARLNLQLPSLGGTLLAAALLAGCQESPFGPGERRELERMHQQWNSSRPANYSMEIRLSCFCANALPEFTRLDIRGDSVVAAHSFTGDPAPIEGWPTVDDLFDDLHGTTESSYDYITGISVRYDPTYGYPTEYHVTCTDNVADCGSSIFVRNLQPLP